MKKTLEEILRKALKKLGIEAGTVEITVPKEEAFGDLSTPVAMGLAKTLRRPPKKIAEDIIDAIDDKAMFADIKTAGAGFINFTFSKTFLYSGIRRLIKAGGFSREDIGKGKKVQIEFVSANPTGPLHLGHGRGAAVGGALANLLKAAGYKVTQEYYVNDAGRQVEILGESVFAAYQRLFQEAYPFPEEGYKGVYIEDLAREIIKTHGDKYSGTAFNEVRGFFIDFSYRMLLQEIESDLRVFGVAFDKWQSERELYKKQEAGSQLPQRKSKVEDAIEELRKRGYIFERDGAVWFRATEFGDDKDRVIVKSNGEYTYFTSDIAYHREKIEAGYDELIDIWGADHHGYIPRVRAVISALGYPEENLKVLLVQMVTLLRGGRPVQMSKRAGEFITLREVIDEVGADTAKFIFLTRRHDSHLNFDLETAKEQSSENPVFYVQYAYARINSIFAHAREQGVRTDMLSDLDLSLLSLPEETRLIKKLLIYPLVFEGAVKSHEPHRITFYLQELAGMFHPYYHRNKVVGDEVELTMARLSLCGAIRIVVRDGLEILGLGAPEKM